MTNSINTPAPFSTFTEAYEAQDQERLDLMSHLSDVYKDAHGFRPRSVYNFAQMSNQDISDEIDRVHAIALENWKEEEIWANAQVEEFKKRIDVIIEMGAEDEETALRWILSAEDNLWSVQDIEHIIWKEGILFTDYGHQLTQRMMKLVDWDAIHSAEVEVPNEPIEEELEALYF